MKKKRAAFARQVSAVGLLLGVAAACGGSSSSSSGGSGGAAGKSSGGAAGAGSPSAGSPSAGSPSAGSPSAGSPSAGSPSGGSPSGGSPSGGSPSGGSPSGGSPSGGRAGATGMAGSAGSGGDCSPACGASRQCCAGQCVNEQNDLHNCGACGIVCDVGMYCGAGKCAKPPCTATCAGGTCCGTECCNESQICCDPQGPIVTGPRCLTPSASGTCPMGCAPICECASPDTPIATPDGERAIASLRVGDLVYSIDGNAVKVVPIVRVKQTPVTRHHVIRVQLASGVALEISGGHPTADGRSFSDLRAGSLLDGVPVISAEKVPYSYSSTFDILPASSSETYFAGGALIGSTIDRSAPVGSAQACVAAP